MTQRNGHELTTLWQSVLKEFIFVNELVVLH